MTEKLVRWAGSWAVCAALIIVWTVVVQHFQWSLLYFTGDEPHYMMSVVSFVRDGDFNNLNNYKQGDYRLFGIDSLSPQFAAYGFKRPDIVPAEHGTIFPLFIAPAFLAGGVDGVRVFLLILSTAACLLLWEFVRVLTGSAQAGTAAALLLAISPTWQMQSSRIYPESTAGLFTVLVLLAFARWSTAPAAMFVAGLLTGFLPLLYTKYIAIAAGLGLAALLLPAVRTSRAFWVGLCVAFVAGVANVLVWGEQGALTGNTANSQAYNFAASGWVARYFRPLFDRHHGLVPFQPFIILFLWAMVPQLRLPRRDDSAGHRVLIGAAVAVLLYTVLHGVWQGSPGYSVPGRYLTATMPLMCVLIVVWARREDRWRTLRWGLIAGGVAVALAFYVVAMWRNTPPYYVLWTWTYLFPRYWDSWDKISLAEMRDVGLLDYLIPIVLLAGTKAAAMWAGRRASGNI